MFEEISTAVAVLFNIIFYCFLYSFEIGKFLVVAVTTLLDVSWILVGILFQLLCVITDSFHIFLLDVLELLQLVKEFLVNSWNFMGYAVCEFEKSINKNVEKFLLMVSSAHSFLEDYIFNVGESIKQLFVLVKYLFVLFGSGVYFAITFLPFTAWNIFMVLVDILNNLHEYIVGIQTGSVQFVKDCGINFYEFLTDVPVESVIGIAVAASLIYLFTHFYVIIFSYMYNQIITSCFNIYYKVFRRRQNNTIHVTHKKLDRISQRRGDVSLLNSSKDASSDERYCVICQERLKCILVLPCRHVCMCSECNSRLQMYHNTCPICRHDIDSTMKIFV